MMKLNKLNTFFYIDPGAAEPLILSTEYELKLLFYYHKAGNSEIEFPIQRDPIEDHGIVNVNFANTIIYKFGYPNDEVLQVHPYYSYGLSSYEIFEVTDSPWVEEIIKMNSAHISNGNSFKNLKHFILTFKDSTFECICKEIEFKFTHQSSIKDALISLCNAY